MFMKPSIRAFVTTPYEGKKRYQPFVDIVLQTLRDNGVSITTPEDQHKYTRTLAKLESEGLGRESAHYRFIVNGIAGSDIVIIEASHEDFRVGHEVTLALLYGKPTLVLSQHIDYSRYIPHDLLKGVQYRSPEMLQSAISSFIKIFENTPPRETTQIVYTAADSLHSAALASLRRGAQLDKSEFGVWARTAEKDSDKAYELIMQTLGDIPIQAPWSVFAPIYNEDSPDVIQTGVAKFIDQQLRRHTIAKRQPIVEAATGTAALARMLVGLGYRDITGFDNSRPMLAEAFRLCAHLPSIKLFEADIATVMLDKPANAIIWTDYSSNFALNPKTLTAWIQRLLQNISDNGVLVFDVRTRNGWQVDFYRQKVTTFASDSFQRVWVNLPDDTKHRVTFDVFIRMRARDGTWEMWRREQMTERMWELSEVKAVVDSLPHITYELFGDDFRAIRSTDTEPNLAYFVLRKH